MMNRPIMVNWKDLKQLGWPYTRAHTQRLMDGGWENEHGEWIAVEHPFPQCVRFGNGLSARRVWSFAKVMDYFKKAGLTIQSD